MKTKRPLSTFPQRDLTGKVFDRLTVIEFSGYKTYKHFLPPRRYDMWKTKCICGEIRIVRGSDLVTKKQRSCGCLLEEFRKNILPTRKYTALPDGQAAKNLLLHIYIMRAKQKGLEFSISKEDFFNFTQQNCYFCGIVPQQTIGDKTKRCSDVYTYNGIDRINSKVGYKLDNVVPCCGICNKAKRDLPIEEFKAWIKRLINYQLNLSR